MHKEIESMTDRELLQELVLQGRRNERANNIKSAVLAALVLAIVILALVCIPKIMAPIRELNANMDGIKSAMSGVEQFVSGFSPDMALKLESTLDSLNETSDQARTMMERLKDSGIENFMSSLDELKSALGDFKASLEGFSGTLGSVLKMFGRT